MHNLTHKLKHYLDGSRQLEDTFKYSTVLYAVAFIHLIITIVFLHYNIFPMYLYNILIFGVYLYMAGVYIKKRLTGLFICSVYPRFCSIPSTPPCWLAGNGAS